KLNDCRMCHLPETTESKDILEPKAKPHNGFGARLKALKQEMAKAGKKTDIMSRLEAIAEEDSDGDGVPNLIEILTGHFPGDAGDKPTDEEVAAARKTLTDFQKYRSGYPWRPFETVQRPAVPKVKNAAWMRNPLDAFLAAEHEERGLKPRPEASRAVLLRRVYLDLIGLPPTPEELHAFLEDGSDDAYDKVVDRLLASPQYGERWGRHWMDIWRYSDWAGWGNEVRDSQPHIWRWRDWIIESLNDDKGYDQMIVEMLAGDEVAPVDPNTLRATGYIVRNWKRYSREKWLQDTVDHTFLAFQATTLACARCHDHQFDPILQKEYYQVRAIFDPHQVRIDRVPGQPDTTKNGVAHAFDGAPDAKTFLFIRGDERNPDTTALLPGVPEAMGGRFPTIEPVKLPRDAYLPDKREFVEKETLQISTESAPKAKAALETSRRNAARAVVQAMFKDPLPSAMQLAVTQTGLNAVSLAELDVPIAEARHTALDAVFRVEHLEEAGKKDTDEWKQAAAQTVLAQRELAILEARRNLLVAQQGRDAKKAEDAGKALDAANAKPQAGVEYAKRPLQTYPATSTGRRLALARWLADRENPLTARVAMNHIWLRHFGQAIVPTVFDFGRNGRQPTHPALLDWLAAEFMDQKWSMKAMHRLIVTSSAYRMASTHDEANVAIDRDNKYLWRMPSRQVEAEVVRDCVFYVAGRLDTALGGPELDQKLGLTSPRRSIYFRHAAEKEVEFLKIFDGADVVECYQRKSTVMPQQALALANSEVTLSYARILARTLAKGASDPAAFTTAAFERVLSRSPTESELAECVTFLRQQTERHATGQTTPAAGEDHDGKMPSTDAALRARENLVHVLLNHHDFVTIR
ncbi:MAG TPA: DUF1549 and DUF1553 domain-containing protein, partial [Gemmataceae bacterium]